MERVVSEWHESGVLEKVLKKKLVFIETKDVVETTLALNNFKRACDCGRGAVFLSVARGKVGACVMTISRVFDCSLAIFGVGRCLR